MQQSKVWIHFICHACLLSKFLACTLKGRFKDHDIGLMHTLCLCLQVVKLGNSLEIDETSAPETAVKLA